MKLFVIALLAVSISVAVYCEEEKKEHHDRHHHHARGEQAHHGHEKEDRKARENRFLTQLFNFFGCVARNILNIFTFQFENCFAPNSTSSSGNNGSVGGNGTRTNSSARMLEIFKIPEVQRILHEGQPLRNGH